MKEGVRMASSSVARSGRRGERPDLEGLSFPVQVDAGADRHVLRAGLDARRVERDRDGQGLSSSTFTEATMAPRREDRNDTEVGLQRVPRDVVEVRRLVRLNACAMVGKGQSRPFPIR
jgi:hypothetical protein